MGFWVFFLDELVKHAKKNGLDTVTRTVENTHTHTRTLVRSHAIKAGEKEQTLSLHWHLSEKKEIIYQTNQCSLLTNKLPLLN